MRRVCGSQVENPKTYVFERSPNGHRLVFLDLLVAHLIRTGANFSLILSKSIRDSPQFGELEAKFRERLDIIWIDPGETLSQVANRALLSRGDLVVVPDGDAALVEVASLSFRPRRPRIRMLVMQNPAWVLRYPADHKIAVLLRIIAKSLVLLVCHMDQRNGVRYLTYPRSAQETPHSRWGKVQDPVIVNQNAELIEDSPVLGTDRVWFGIVGGINDRKNPRLLCEAVAIAATQTREKLGVALLGPLAPSVENSVPELREILESSHAGLVVDGRRRTNEQMNAEIARLDVVATVYSTVAPNSTCAKASFYRTSLLIAGPRQYLNVSYQISGQDGVSLDKNSIARRIVTIVEEKPHPIAREFHPAEEFARELLAL